MQLITTDNHNFAGAPSLYAGVSSDAKQLKTEYLTNIASKLQNQLMITQKFYDLSETWKVETRGYSSIRDIAFNSAYQQIIGMGEKVTGLILKDLNASRENPSHWFPALRAIEGFSPIEESQKGKVKEMANSWIEWGKANGLL